jgi:hypothetical protein
MTHLVRFFTPALFLLAVCAVSAQTTAISYQGSLSDGTAPANGSYQFQFKLYVHVD